MTTVPIAHTGAGDVTTAASGSGASITIDRPPNTAAGDLLLCAVFHQLSGGALTRPAGWLPCGPFGTTVGTYSAFWRAVGPVGNEPSTYTWTNTGGARSVAVMFRVTGANLAAPIDAFGTVSTVGTVAVTAPGLTATQDNTLLVAAWVASRGAGLDPPVITPPTPMISVGTVTAAPSSSSTMRVAVTPRGDSGAVSSKTAEIAPTASSATAFLIAIAPAADAMPLTEFPDVRLEVAFTDGASTGTGLTLDDPSRGLLDTGTLGGGFTSDPVWTDIRPWLRSATISRGSTRVDSPVVTYEPGTLSAVLDNSDRRFDSAYMDGPYTQESTTTIGEETLLNSNTGFESGTSGWAAFGGTLTQDAAQFHAGAFSGKVVPDGTSFFTEIRGDLFAATAGQTYKVSAWLRCASARTASIGIHWWDADGVYLGVSSFGAVAPLAAATWTRFTHQAVAPTGAHFACLDASMSGTPAASAVLWLDEAELLHLPYGRASQVTAMRAVRVLATWDGVTYELWRGFADMWDTTWTPGSAYAECTLTATDAAKVLSGVDRTAVAPVGGGEDSGARVTRILDSAGWPVGDRVVTDGDSTLQATTLEGDAWAELQTVSASEIGELYVDGGGRVVFRNRLAYLSDARSHTSQGTFGDGDDELPIEELGQANDDSTFFNDVRVTVPGGTEQVAEDEASIEFNYRKTYRPPEPILQDDGDALAYAQWLLHIASRPELRFTDLVTLPALGPAELWPHALGREIGDRITVTRRPPPDEVPITREQFIRGVKHEFTDETWKTTWTLQDATRHGSFFVLDHTELGVLDANALAY